MTKVKKVRAPRKPKLVSVTISDGISSAFGIADELRDELQTWRDGMPENLSGSDKASMLDDAIQSLEANSEPDVPDAISGFDVQYKPGKLRRASRADRLDEATSILRAIMDKCDGIVNDPGAYASDEIEEITQFSESINDAIDEWERVEFPGLYG